MTPPRHRAVWLLILLVSALAAGGAGLAAWHLARAALAERVDNALVLTARTLEAEIERFRYLPAVALEDPRIRAAVLAPADPAATATANRALAVAARQSGADELYLLDAAGTAIASSNWRDETSFVGENYGFRPYFREAMQNGAGRFYAVGVTTGQPGYFMATRGRVEGRAAVVVVKVDLRPLQATWSDAGDMLTVADGFGVVILSGQPRWVYRPLAPLEAPARAAIAAHRAFAAIPVTDRAPLLRHPDQAEVVVAGQRRLLRRQALPLDGWTLLGSGSLVPAARIAWGTGAGVLLAGLALGALAQTWRQRRRMVEMRLRQGEILEARVAERTAELAREIDERRRTEADLRAAQDALVHSEKMAALGRMSAAIVHEISQPLAAMEATLAATLLSGKVTEDYAVSRIEKARSHIRRMLRTIRHLKSFSRREGATRRPTEIDPAIRNAMELVAPRAQDIGLRIGFAGSGETPRILAGSVRLEQVLVNLLMNALDAVAGRPDPQVRIERRQAEGAVVIAVIDNGPGIPATLLARVSEPFFSTKESGESLGLGLSISRTIVEEFGGALELAPGPGGGTVARLRFAALGDRMAAE
jgi:two-component system C4-dicarboxylate transport sensor histidine kinase DctB